MPFQDKSVRKEARECSVRHSQCWRESEAFRANFSNNSGHAPLRKRDLQTLSQSDSSELWIANLGEVAAAFCYQVLSHLKY